MYLEESSCKLLAQQGWMPALIKTESPPGAPNYISGGIKVQIQIRRNLLNAPRQRRMKAGLMLLLQLRVDLRAYIGQADCGGGGGFVPAWFIAKSFVAFRFLRQATSEFLQQLGHAIVHCRFFSCAT